MSESAKSIQLPPGIIRRVHRAAKRVKRAPSDLAAEALEWYFRVCALPEEIPTQAELRAIRRGRKAFKKGHYILLDEFCRKEAMGHRPYRSRAKSS